ncbi:MAG: arsenosugar biosynthesis radical SAM protein ArsS [Flavobacteriales bacterium]|nr:arsenosugar biosynthesis radical SAM protein ArsS [Flavobacteriales bacterium]
MNSVKTLHAQHHKLADTAHQLEVLEMESGIPAFQQKLATVGLYPLKPTGIEIFQVNIGYMCNQTCKHCHVDAGPDRKEIMTRSTMQQILDLIEQHHFSTIDITGGAPELNPDFRWFIEELRKRDADCKIIVRCNLTIILSNKKFNDLPQFYKEHRLEVVSSLPFYSADRTDRQRGEGVFMQSVKALQMLNEIGYGKEKTGLILNLVYNPSGAFLPASQDQLEKDFKNELKRNYDIEFNNLFAITNMPISRFLDYLIQTENYQKYMEKLVNAFNPVAATGVMCRNTISVGWDGNLYDCDFNQMLGLKTDNNAPQHVSNFDLQKLKNRTIVINQHCFGCTAGSGSSCGGAVA